MDLSRPIIDCVEEAREYGINDLFSDNNYRTLQLLKCFGLKDAPGRQGHDAFYMDLSFELKTTVTGKVFSTSQRFTLSRLEAYRQIDYWIFGLFNNPFEAEAIYIARTEDLEPWFKKQEQKLLKKEAQGKKAILNDPRIRLSFVKKVAMKIKKPKPKHITTKEFIIMIFNDIDDEIIDDEITLSFKDIIKEQANKLADSRIQKLCQKLEEKLCKVLQPAYIKEVFKTLDQDNINSVSSKVVSAAPAEKKAKDKINEEALCSFIEDKVVITENQRYYVSDNTFTKHFRDYFWKKYGYEPPNKNPSITQKIFVRFGIKRDGKKGRILGISLKDMKKKSILPDAGQG